MWFKIIGLSVRTGETFDTTHTFTVSLTLQLTYFNYMTSLHQQTENLIIYQVLVTVQGSLTRASNYTLHNVVTSSLSHTDGNVN